MKMEKNKTNSGEKYGLVDQDNALYRFLDSLLSEDVVNSGEPAKAAGRGSQNQFSMIPEWAWQSFRCMLFNVGNVTLAMPVDKMNSILPWNNGVINTRSSGSYFLGEITHRAQSVKIIDMQKFIAGGQGPSQPTQHEPAIIILTENLKYGLACQSTGDVITLESSQLRWSQGQTRHPWFRAIILEQKQALLDVDLLINAVESG